MPEKNIPYSNKCVSRYFLGVWIPKELYLNKDLSWTEKILLIEIQSLQGNNGCFASNEYLANFLDLSNSKTISNMITKLKKLNLIIDRGKRNLKRLLFVNFDSIVKDRSLPNDLSTMFEENTSHENMTCIPQKNDFYIYNNKDNNSSVLYSNNSLLSHNELIKNNEIFNIGIPLINKQIGDESKSRTIIGKLIKDFKHEIVLKAIRFVINNKKENKSIVEQIYKYINYLTGKYESYSKIDKDEQEKNNELFCQQHRKELLDKIELKSYRLRELIEYNEINNEIWVDLKSKLKQQYGDCIFKAWLYNLFLINNNRTELRILCENDFVKTIITRNYLYEIKNKIIPANLILLSLSEININYIKEELLYVQDK